MISRLLQMRFVRYRQSNETCVTLLPAIHLAPASIGANV
jgi:hypothetical protein